MDNYTRNSGRKRKNSALEKYSTGVLRNLGKVPGVKFLTLAALLATIPYGCSVTNKTYNPAPMSSEEMENHRRDIESRLAEMTKGSASRDSRTRSTSSDKGEKNLYIILGAIGGVLFLPLLLGGGSGGTAAATGVNEVGGGAGIYGPLAF